MTMRHSSGKKVGHAPAPTKKPFGAHTAYAEHSKTNIPIGGHSRTNTTTHMGKKK